MSRQNPTFARFSLPESCTASHSRAIRSSCRAIALSPPAVFSISSGTGSSARSMHLRQLSNPVLRVVPLADVTAVHDDALDADLGGLVQRLLQQLAARDPDPVVQRRDVQHVRRVHVEIDSVRGRPLTQRLGPVGVRHLRALPPLRIAEEELDQVRTPVRGLRQRVVLIDVRTKFQAHTGTL